jgi:putative MATE family efflux protein
MSRRGAPRRFARGAITIRAETGLPKSEELPLALRQLAWPVLFEQTLAACVGFFDVYLSGRLGDIETSAIGLAAYVSWLASMLASLVGMGTTVLVARHWGAGEFLEARRITARSLFLGAVLGLIIVMILRGLAPTFSQLLGMKGLAREVAEQYLRWDAFGQACACLTLISAAALRGTGDMRTPLVILGLTNLCNVIISTGCVYGWGPLPALGVFGIVVGTVAAQVIGLLGMLVALLGGTARLSISWGDIRWHAATVHRLLRIGVPAALDGLITFTGHFLFLMVIARLSDNGFDGPVFAAHIVGVRLESICYLPAVAWALAAASLVGRYLGAGSHELAFETGRRAILQFMPYAALMSAVFFVAAPWLFQVMHKDAAVAEAGISAFRLMALYQIPNSCLIIWSYCLRGAGDTRYPLFCAVLGVLGLRVPIAYVCGVVWEGGLWGAWLGMGVDNLTRAALMGWRYSGRRWQKVSV